MKKSDRRSFIFLVLSVSTAPLWCNPSTAADLPKFERVVIDADFPGAYQVEVADVNGDKKPDIVAVGGSTCAWYENPTWKKRVVTTGKQTPGIITSATADVDGDGKAEIAVGYEFEMNEPRKGKLLLASQGATVDDPWTLRPSSDSPSIHRLRWLSQRGTVRLVVAPIFGPAAKPPKFDQSPAQPRIFSPVGRDAVSRAIGEWHVEDLPGRPVMHSICVVDDPAPDFVPARGPGAIPLYRPPFLLSADNLGVGFFGWSTSRSGRPRVVTLVPGAPGEAPKRGASEIHPGKLADGRSFLAMIEPWHGSEVVVNLATAPGSAKWGDRTVIDDTLADGHALWTADVDGDGDDEVFAGHRGKDHRVSAYDFDGKTWKRTVIDSEIAAQDLRGGDIDGDGRPDVVAVGGSTHNVIWYRPIKAR